MLGCFSWKFKGKLFPLNSSCGFGGKVVENSVDALNLACNSICDLMEKRVGNLLNSCAHSIGSVYRTDYCGPTFIAAFILNANALDVGNSDEVLPYLARKSGFIKLITEDSVSLAQSLKSVLGNCAKTSYAKSGAGD